MIILIILLLIFFLLPVRISGGEEVPNFVTLRDSPRKIKKIFKTHDRVEVFTTRRKHDFFVKFLKKSPESKIYYVDDKKYFGIRSGKKSDELNMIDALLAITIATENDLEVRGLSILEKYPEAFQLLKIDGMLLTGTETIEIPNVEHFLKKIGIELIKCQ